MGAIPTTAIMGYVTKMWIFCLGGIPTFVVFRCYLCNYNCENSKAFMVSSSKYSIDSGFLSISRIYGDSGGVNINYLA